MCKTDQMKHLLTAIACFFALSMSAQTWNPDADFDNVIGVNDLMELLTVFGTEWTATYPQNPDFELAAYHEGQKKAFECIRSCNANGGRVITPFEYAIFQDSINVAMQGDLYGWFTHSSLYSHIGGFTADTGIMYFDGNNSMAYKSIQTLAEKHCFCTGLVPVVD